MKQTKLFFILAVIATAFITQSAHARIWRVNNLSNFNGTTLFGEYFGGTAINPVFNEINRAVAWQLVKDGDTLHIEGSSGLYASAIITKKLVIIGPGYFLGENSNTSTNTNSASIPEISFNAGSEGSQVIGLNVVNNGNSGSAVIRVDVNGIIVKRCRIERAVAFNTPIVDVYIVQNFFANVQNTNALFTNGNSGFIPPTNIVFNNNICQKTLLWDGSFSQCNNNVFDGLSNTLNIKISTAEFKNNILKPLNASVIINNGTGQNVTYNTGTSVNQFGTASGNIAVIDISTIFVDPAGQGTDSRYQLKPGTAAGSDGTERGVFGGSGVANHYTLSGLANIPAIYSIITSGTAGPAGLQVTIKARTIK